MNPLPASTTLPPTASTTTASTQEKTVETKRFLFKGNLIPKPTPLAVHDGNIIAVHISKRGNMIVTGGKDKKVVLSKRFPPRKLLSFEKHTDIIRWVYLSEQGWALSAGNDGMIYQWDTLTGEVIGSIGKLESPILVGAVNQDETQFLFAYSPIKDGLDTHVIKHSPLPLDTNRELQTFSDEDLSAIWCLHWKENSEGYYGGDESGTLRIWGLSNKNPGFMKKTAYEKEVGFVSLFDQEKYIITGGSDGIVYHYTVSSQRESDNLPRLYSQLNQEIWCGFVYQDGNGEGYVFSGGDKGLEIFRISTGTQVSRMALGGIESMVKSQERYLVMDDPQEKGTAMIWEMGYEAVTVSGGNTTFDDRLKEARNEKRIIPPGEQDARQPIFGAHPYYFPIELNK